jgi:tetratricopeptide (TPR) repeat protein
MRRAKNFLKLSSLFAALACLALASNARAQALGSISFPTTGAAAAQPYFLEGVKELHSFQFDEAAVAFQKAEQLDPNFAMAYWGEAMSHNHPLWSEVDVPTAKAALEKFTPAMREHFAKSGSEKEKAYVEAVHHLFYDAGDKLARDTAYSQAMAKMYERWPDDHEVDILYALSLLGTVRPGDAGFRRQALAASICMKVFQENPDHPGAAHFIIHAFDDPDHAILALPAARAYAKIAPAAAHAVHMPSHIFLRLGMWQDLVKSNIVAYQSAVELNQRMHLTEGREDFHTLAWLEYGNLMLGKFDDAKKNLGLAKAADERNPGSRAVHQGYLTMRARYILETGQCEKIAVEQPAAAAPAGDAIDYARGADNGAWTFIAGYCAAKMGDLATADQAIARIRSLKEQTEKGEKAYAAKPFAIMEKELMAEAQLARGQKDDAVRLAKEAADIDLTLAPPFGPPEPIQPGLELYGDVLLAAGHASEAAKAYEQELLKMPNRTPTVKGLAAARAAQGPAEAAAQLQTK